MKIFQLIDLIIRLFKLNKKSKVVLLFLIPTFLVGQNNAAFWLGKRPVSGGLPIVTDNLILHYDISNSSSYPGSGTTVTDLSPTGRNATLVGGPTFTTTFGGELVFDDVDDYGTVTGSSPLNALSNFTVEMVAAVNSISNFDGLFFKTSTNLWNDGFGCYYENNFLKFWLNAYNLNIVSYNIGANEPVKHYTFSYNGSQLKLYVNGVNVSNFSYSSAILNTSANLLFFARPVSGGIGGFSGGDFYIFRMYSDALSDAEVLSNFNATKTRFGL